MKFRLRENKAINRRRLTLRHGKGEELIKGWDKVPAPEDKADVAVQSTSTSSIINATNGPSGLFSPQGSFLPGFAHGFVYPSLPLHVLRHVRQQRCANHQRSMSLMQPQKHIGLFCINDRSFGAC